MFIVSRDGCEINIFQNIVRENMAKISIRCGFCDHTYNVDAAELPFTCNYCQCTVDTPASHRTLDGKDLTDSLLAVKTATIAAREADATLRSLPDKTDSRAFKKGRYTVKKELGSGGMGKILLVQDTHLERQVAMKVLKNQGNSDSMEQRFVTEAKITAQLDHPNIVPIYDLDHGSDGALYFTMKEIKGQNLSTLLRKVKAGEKLPERSLYRRLQIFLKICQAVSYAHAHGILHRDLKPDNVMVGEFGEVMLVDWGIAKLRQLSEENRSALATLSAAAKNSGATRFGQIIGTPGYMPPEQANGDLREIDERSDIYGLGAVLCEMATLQPPFAATNVVELVYKSLEEEPLIPPRDASGQKIPRKLAAIIGKAMSKKKEGRYPTVRILEQEIDNFIEGKPVLARRENFLEKLSRLARVNTVNNLDVGDVVLLFVVLIAFGALLLHWEKGQAADRRWRDMVVAAHIALEQGREAQENKIGVAPQQQQELQRQAERYYMRALVYAEEARKFNPEAPVEDIFSALANMQK